MNAHSEIVRLFKSLSEDEKGLVLKELGQASMGETVLLEEADVVCWNPSFDGIMAHCILCSSLIWHMIRLLLPSMYFSAIFAGIGK
jgi:hypothetical protein